MRTGRWELVIVWETGETQVYEYETEQDADRGAQNMLMAFGNQIQWTGCRPQYYKAAE